MKALQREAKERGSELTEYESTIQHLCIAMATRMATRMAATMGAATGVRQADKALQKELLAAAMIPEKPAEERSLLLQQAISLSLLGRDKRADECFQKLALLADLTPLEQFVIAFNAHHRKNDLQAEILLKEAPPEETPPSLQHALLLLKLEVGLGRKNTFWVQELSASASFWPTAETALEPLQVKALREQLVLWQKTPMGKLSDKLQDLLNAWRIKVLRDLSRAMLEKEEVGLAAWLAPQPQPSESRPKTPVSEPAVIQETERTVLLQTVASKVIPPIPVPRTPTPHPPLPPTATPRPVVKAEAKTSPEAENSFPLNTILGLVICLLLVVGLVGLGFLKRSKSGLNGDLSETELLTLVHLFNQQRKTGILNLRSGPAQGKIWFLNGGIDAAELFPDMGTTALYQIFAWKVGTFNFVATSFKKKEQITLSTQHLLLEYVRRLDEQERDSGGINT
jgi:hypothetical protein